MLLRYLIFCLILRGDKIIGARVEKLGESKNNKWVSEPEENHPESGNPGCTGHDLAIYPKTNLFLNVNTSTHLLCGVDGLSNISSDTIFFTKSLKKLRPISSEKVDNNTIRTTIREEETKQMKLYCLDVNGNQMCSRQVFVGFPPLDVDNFHCISLNWRTLQCAYDLKVNHAQLKTDDYHLCYESFETYGCETGMKCSRNDLRCCQLEGAECWTWGVSPDYYYDKTSKILRFTIASKNALGVRKYDHILDHFAAVVPGRPERFRAKALTSKDVLISFRLPLFMKSFPPGIIYRIAYQVWDEKHFILGRSSKESLIEIELELPWPGQNYSFTLTLKSGSEGMLEGSFDEDALWSESSITYATLQPTAPTNPPKTAPGAFQVKDLGSTRQIIIAWEALEDKMKGGPDFRYDVKAYSDEQSLKMSAGIVTEYYAVFENASNEAVYEFCIAATNSEGASNLSVVQVSNSQDLPPNIHFPLVLYHKDEDVIEMRWFPEESKPILYTLFWCADGSLFSENPCNGTLKWKMVENATSFNMSSSDLDGEFDLTSLRFALSATLEDSKISGGMIWSNCPLKTYSYNSFEPPPLPEVVARHPLQVLIKWNLNCDHWASGISSIEVFWCPGNQSHPSQCDAGDLKTEKVSLWPPLLNLNKLNPETNYTIWIEATFRSGKTEVSPGISFVTDELALGLGMIVLASLITIAGAILLLAMFIPFIRNIHYGYKDSNWPVDVPPGINTPSWPNPSSNQDVNETLLPQFHISDPTSEKPLDALIPDNQVPPKLGDDDLGNKKKPSGEYNVSTVAECIPPKSMNGYSTLDSMNNLMRVNSTANENPKDSFAEGYICASNAEDSWKTIEDCKFSGAS